MGVTVLGRAAESEHQMHFLRFLRENWGEFQNGMYVKGGESINTM